MAAIYRTDEDGCGTFELHRSVGVLSDCAGHAEPQSVGLVIPPTALRPLYVNAVLVAGLGTEPPVAEQIGLAGDQTGIGARGPLPHQLGGVDGRTDVLFVVGGDFAVAAIG